MISTIISNWSFSSILSFSLTLSDYSILNSYEIPKSETLIAICPDPRINYWISKLQAHQKLLILSHFPTPFGQQIFVPVEVDCQVYKVEKLDLEKLTQQYSNIWVFNAKYKKEYPNVKYLSSNLDIMKQDLEKADCIVDAGYSYDEHITKFKGIAILARKLEKFEKDIRASFSPICYRVNKYQEHVKIKYEIIQPTFLNIGKKLERVWKKWEMEGYDLNPILVIIAFLQTQELEIFNYKKFDDFETKFYIQNFGSESDLGIFLNIWLKYQTESYSLQEFSKIYKLNYNRLKLISSLLAYYIQEFTKAGFEAKAENWTSQEVQEDFKKCMKEIFDEEYERVDFNLYKNEKGEKYYNGLLNNGSKNDKISVLYETKNAIELIF